MRRNPWLAIHKKNTALYVWYLLVPLFCYSSHADESEAILAPISTATRLYHSGDVLGARKAFEEVAHQEPSQNTRLVHRYALLNLIELCQSVYDQICVLEYAGRILALRNPVEFDALEMLEEAYSSAVSMSSMPIESLVADGQQSADLETIFDAIEASYPQMLGVAPYLYIGSNFAQAEVFLKRNLLEQAGLALDRAIAAMVTTELTDDVQLAKQIRTSLSLLLRTGQSDRADRLLSIAGPFLDRAGGLSLPENVHNQLVVGHVLVARNKAPAALAAYRKGLDALNRLNVPQYLSDWLAHEFLINIAALCVASSDLECVADAVARHPLANDAELIEDGRYRDTTAYQYAVARVVANAVTGSPIDDRWLDALEVEPKGALSQADADLLKTYGHLARGIAFGVRDPNLPTGLSEAMRAGELRLSWLETESVGHYQPEILDRLVVQFGLAANAASTTMQERSFQDDDIALKLIQANNRTLRDIDGDRLWTLSTAGDELDQRRLHTLDRLRSRRLYMESQLLFWQIERLWAGGSVPPGSGRGIDFATFGRLAEMDLVQYRLQRESVPNQREPSEKSLHVGLETVQRDLKDGEALISVSAAVNSLVSICVRRDKALVVAKPFQSEKFFEDMQAVQQELQFLGRPSYSNDAKFAVESAVRIYDTLFEPVQECLEDINHIVWIPPAPLGVFPIGALLPESPPKVGELYDLSVARWLAKDYAISYATSVRSFVAARSIGASGEADLPFLGVGDPVLSDPINNGKTGGEVLIAGAAATRSGALDTLLELPEASAELRSIADLEGDNSALLLRDAATEQELRNQILGRYKAIAFATHGLIRADDARLRESSLVLTPGDRQQSWNDGLLTAGEIADLNLHAKMVTLSACNAANFDWSVFAGETLGLTTAFATAGVPSLMATLWPVESDTSRRISTGLYSSLESGEPETSPAASLQQSIIEFLDAPPATTHHHPRYWAPFVIFGDGGIRWKDDAAPSTKLKERDFLGRFSRGGAFLDIRLSRGGQYAYVSGYGDMINGRFQSVLAKIDQHANVHWLKKEPTTGSTFIVTADDSSVVVAGFVDREEGSLPVIRKVDNNGDELWRQDIDLGAGWSGFFGGAYESNSSVTSMIFLASQNREESEPHGLHFVELSATGEQNPRGVIALPSSRNWRKTVVRQFGDDVLVAVISRSNFISKKYRDRYGIVRICEQMPSTLLFRIDAATGNVETERDFPNIEINDLLQDDAGRIFGAATIFHDCMGGSTAALIEMNSSDFDVKYIHPGEPDSDARALVKDKDGGLVLVGASERVFGARSLPAGDDVLAAIDGQVIERIADGFIARFSSVDSQPTIRWLQAGASLRLRAGVLFGDKLLIAGSSGQQPYWIFVE